MRLWRWAGVSVVVAIIAGGCSSSGSTVDAGELERDIKTELQRSNRVSKVDCPDGVKREKGETFECTATVEGTPQTIDVELTSDESYDFTLRS